MQQMALVRRRARMLTLIRDNISQGKPAPTIHELMDVLNVSSTSVVSNDLKRLEEAGHIRLSEGKSRSIRLVERGPSPQQQVKALLAVIHEAARDLERWASENTSDPAFAADLTGIAEGLRAGAAEAIGAAQ